MSREVCGVCWCPYDEKTGKCACAPAPKAAPPQRKPLTEEELDALAIDEDGLPNSHIEFARAIERAHGII